MTWSPYNSLMHFTTSLNVDCCQRRVFTNEADPLCCMQTGLSFFKSWCDECIKEGTAIVLCNSVPSCAFILFNTHLIVYTCMCMIHVLSCLHSCLTLNSPHLSIFPSLPCIHSYITMYTHIYYTYTCMKMEILWMTHKQHSWHGKPGIC